MTRQDPQQARQPGREASMRPAPDYMPRYAGSERLHGKAALVSGGDSGIGRAVCVLFAREGADIALLHLDEDDDAAETSESTPMKRPGQPNEVAPAFLFLACDDASYITGQVIHPNGGEPVGS